MTTPFKTFVLFTAILGWGIGVVAQVGRYEVRSISIEGYASKTIELSDVIREGSPFISVSLQAADFDQIRDLKIIGGSDTWVINEPDHPQPWEQVVYSPLIFVNREVKHIVIHNPHATHIRFTLHLFTPSPILPSDITPSIRLRSGCDRLPPHKLRMDWCPSGDCPYGGNRTQTTPTHMIVHHSAGKNTSNDWDGVVRSIWHYHVVQRGWDDIGYNWLIAPTGQLYEGRGDRIKGAHFCGYNSKTMGVCMMGTYTGVPPTDTAVHTLEGLLTWTGFKYKIQPLKRTLHTVSNSKLYGVSGHRDRCNTACPGDMLFNLLPVIRKEVSDRLEQCGFKQGKEDNPVDPGHNPGKNGFFVRPTLVKDELTVRIGQDIGLPVELALLDASGRLVRYEMVKHAGDLTLKLSDVTAGLYILYASNSFKKWQVKLVKL